MTVKNVAHKKLHLLLDSIAASQPEPKEDILMDVTDIRNADLVFDLGKYYVHL